MPPTPTSNDPYTLKAHWDAEYDDGRWNFLRGLKEQARSGIIAAWLKEARALEHVADIGCGEALLYHYLKPYEMAHYTGVDVSPKALALAKVDPAASTLIEAPLETFEPPEGHSYSAIVFNEVLYFPDDPGAEFRRYAEMLKPDGVLAVSMYAPNRADSGAHKAIKAVWDAASGEGFKVLDDLTIHGELKNVTWKLLLATREA